MKIKSLDMIWAKSLTKKKLDSGIFLPEGVSHSNRLGAEFFEAEVVEIGFTIPKDLIESADGKQKLEPGDIIFVQKWNNETEWQRTINFEGNKYLLISAHDIMGIDKKK